MKTQVSAASRLHPAPKPILPKETTKNQLVGLLQNMTYGAGLDVPEKVFRTKRKSELLGIVNSVASLVSRSALRSALGQSFYGKRDLYDVLGWKKELMFDDFLMMYERNGIAKRVVDVKADECWREMPIIHDGRGNDRKDFMDNTKFLKEWLDLVEKKNLASVFHELDTALGISRFSVIVVGVQGDRDFSKELEKGGVKTIATLRVLDEGMVTMADPVDDETDPRYGMPKLYNCQFEKDGKSVQVHWTRVIHFKQGRGRSNIYGIPGLQSSFNYLSDLEKVTGSSSEAFWQHIRRAIILAANEGFTLPEKGTPEYTTMMDQVENLEHQASLVIRLRNMNATQLPSTVIDASGQAELLLSQVAGTEGIPQRILLGSERGELASSQDIMNMNNATRARQKKTCAPWVRQFIEYLYTNGFISAPDNSKFQIEWESLIELTPSEKMDLANTAAEVLDKITGGNIEMAMTIGDFMRIYMDGYVLPQGATEKEPPKEIPPKEPESKENGNIASGLSDESQEPMKA